MTQVKRWFLSVSSLLIMGLVASCGGSRDPNLPLTPGQTDFVNSEPANGYGRRSGWEEPGLMGAEDSAPSQKAEPPGAPPQGRTGEVEEADIYRVDNNRLFYLNTYRGFLIFDLTDPKTPQQVSRLPVYGYPIEMFVQGSTVYALIRDALYLTQVNGTLQFKRHNVSQLLAIDISDLKHPKILQTVDIIGELREGVSRKIENTIYVVSYRSQYYYWDWNYGNSTEEQKEQAWVYSFNVADPKNMVLKDQLQVFEGGGYSYHDEHYNTSVSRYFEGVTIAATSNALMVTENWQTYGWVSGSKYNCGSYNSQEQAVISIVDISDPQGTISLHTKFETYGNLSDQFKQTYIFDEKTGKGTYLGIFGRREWSSANCQGSSLIQNTLESWDITDGKNPKKMDELAFGKPNETVRGSVFDAERSVAFAITARNVDPLYALSFADPTQLKILSAVDGLSGDMNVFRFIEGKKYLIGIGRDNSDTCTGFGDPSTGWSTNVAVSIIDVQNLNQIRLVQRQCVAVQSASWVNSELNWNLDQAHKMIGMHSDGTVNALTIPVYYHKKQGDNDWWWYGYETAVGLMTWDLSQYDPQKDELHQNVLQNYGTIIHPKGEVRRSIIFTHQGSTDRRMLINLSNTHLSVVDIQDLNHPITQSIIEVAPYYSQLFRFGDYMVEHVNPNQWGYYYEYGGSNQNASEFRIKKLQSTLEDAEVVASFTVGQVERVLKHKDNLVLFRRIYQDNSSEPWYNRWQAEVLVYDLSNPAAPKKQSTLIIPEPIVPYYWYWCGVDAYWGGYWFNNYSQNNTWTVTDTGLVFFSYAYDYQQNLPQRKLVFIDLSNPAAPSYEEQELSIDDTTTYFGVTPDPTAANTFYLSYRDKVGEMSIDGDTFYQYKYYAQKWSYDGSSWKADYAVNIPGQLMKTWDLNGTKALLTYDYTYKKRTINEGSSPYTTWQSSFRVNLLRELDSWGGAPLAELLDFHNFQSQNLKDLIVDGTKLFVNSRQDYYYTRTNNIPWEEISDHLMIFDLSNLKLNKMFSEPTGTYSVQLMGTYQGRLFINLPGDGVLVVDASDPAQPVGQQFMRTLGYSTHIEFANNTAFLASGYFGVYEMNLSGPSAIPAL